MATIKEIARLAGVSATTVSNVIHGNKGKVSAEKFAKVEKILNDLHFAPNLAAAMLAHNTTHIVGIILNYDKRDGNTVLQDPYASAIVGAIQQELQKYGYYTMLYSSTNYNEWFRLISTWNMAGLIVLGISQEKVEQVRLQSQVPLVFIDSYLSNKEEDEKKDLNKTFYNVGLDDLDGAKKMTEFLISKGHKNIAYLADREEPQGVDAFRLLGFKKAMNEKNLPGEYIFLGRNKSDREKIILNLMKEKKFTALFFASDYYACDAIHFLALNNYKVPEDISIAGFDDNQYARLSLPELTTVHQDVYEKGSAAVQLLMSLLKKENIAVTNIRLKTSIIERKSVGSLN